jgi:carbamoyltransferase
VLDEYAQLLFGCDGSSPYMMFTYNVATNNLPAVTHVDSTARIQTVSEKDNPLYYLLLKCFHDQTGCPVLLNTSFNVMGEPIVCTPQDAINTFLKSGLDYLVIGNFIINK